VDFSMILFMTASLFASASLVKLLLKVRSDNTRDGRLTSFFYLSCIVLAWILLNLLTAVTKPEYYHFANKLKLVIVCIIPYATCWFFMNVIKSRLVDSKIFKIILIALPAISILAIQTNPFHKQIYLAYEYPFYPLGPLFWIYLSLSTGTAVFTYVLVVIYIVKHFRRQPWMIAICIIAIFPYFLNVMYSFNLLGFMWDLTPLGYFVLVISFAYVSTNSQMFHYRSETLSLMFDTIRQIIITVNNHGNIIDANKSFIKVFPDYPISFGTTPITDFIEYIKKQSMNCIPENLLDSFCDYKNDEIISGEINISIPEFKTYIISRVPIRQFGEIINYTITFDDVSDYRGMLTDLNRVLENLDYRDVLLNAINQAAVLLLNSNIHTFEDAIYEGMQEIAEAVDVDCIYLWKNHIVDGKLYCSQVFEWSPVRTMFADNQLYNYNDVVPGWEEKLSAGKIINSLVRDMSEKEQAHLSPSGILSILVVPIFIDELFWGFVGYDDCTKERIFTKEEESLLQSGSLLIANAYIRNEQIQLMLKGMERERDLEIQKQTALAANEAKMHFLARMSHEIRTPMNAIIGMSDILLSENLTANQHRYAEDIKISSNALLEIINDIMDLSKIHASKLSLVPVHYDFRVFLNNICSMTQFLIQDKVFSRSDKTLGFVRDIPDNIPKCLYGDDVRLRQILLNLLSNAVKYTKEGDVALTLRFDETRMMITVADSGIGIPPEDITRLFDAFEQADTEKNRGMQGTGLGLTIVKSLVDLMGGNISVESTYGKGSSFHLVIPYELGNEELIRIENNKAEIVYAPDANVLAVDDRESNLTVICGLLYNCRIIADKAISGLQAIEMVKKKKYDLILMDHMMPEMDGVEATKHLRAMNIDTPVIALTANVISGAKELLLDAGMNDYLSKPIDVQRLYDILATWLPAEKIIIETEIGKREEEPVELDVSNNLFWKKIDMIKGLNVKLGLELVSGQRKIYKNTLETTMQEIFKSNEKLYKLPVDRDLKAFCTEVHGLKGSLATIGALGISAKAARLENASNDGDFDYCIENLDDFIWELTSFGNELKRVFVETWEGQEAFDIPVELKPILLRITEAMDSTDFSVIYEEVDKLNELDVSGILKEEIEMLGEALMIMNYEHARVVIGRLMD